MDSSQLRNSSDLRNIVQLVQSERLRRPEHPHPDAPDVETTSDAGDGVKSSAERRQKIIQQLLNKRKLGSGEGSVQSAQSENEGEHAWARSLGTNFPYTHESTAPLQQAPSSTIPTQHYDQQNRIHNDEQFNSYNDVPPPPPADIMEIAPVSRENSRTLSVQKQTPGRSSTRGTIQRSQSAGRQRSASTGRGRSDSYGSAMNGRALDDSQIGDPRTHRILQTDALIKQEMFKECTFKPKINLSAHRASADDNAPFYDRATKWQMTKEQDAIKRKANLDKVQTADWTFRPQINRNSIKAAKELRGDVGDVCTRLYRGNEEIAAMRAKYVDDEQKREQEIESRLCTFQPQCVTDKTKYAYVAPKYNSVEHKPKDTGFVDANIKECTFTPKVSCMQYVYVLLCDGLSSLMI